MPNLGAHMSIAGGYYKAVEAASRVVHRRYLRTRGALLRVTDPR